MLRLTDNGGAGAGSGGSTGSGGIIGNPGVTHGNLNDKLKLSGNMMSIVDYHLALPKLRSVLYAPPSLPARVATTYGCQNLPNGTRILEDSINDTD